MRRSAYSITYIATIALTLCALLVLGWLFGSRSVASFVIAYGSSLLVILSSYHAVRKRLDKELVDTADLPQSTHQSPQDSPPESTSPESHKPSFLSRFILGIQISFGFYRLLSYVVLIAGVVVLMHYGAFQIIGYVAGVLLCAIGVALLARAHLKRLESSPDSLSK